MDYQLGKDWKPLKEAVREKPVELFSPVYKTGLNQVISLWQEAFEWTYYDEVLAGMLIGKIDPKSSALKSFQVLFCIDDRESSFRSYIGKLDTHSETFATPGFFDVEFYYQPEHGRHYTKHCPASVFPKYLIKEKETKGKREKDFHFDKGSHSLVGGSFLSPTLGFWSAFKLLKNIFKPLMVPESLSSLMHMNRYSTLTIENVTLNDTENGLQVGFTIEEMTNRVESLFKSIGLLTNFSPIIYVIGHGVSTINNPHYAAYDCGACCGRPGSVNARVFSIMAN